MRDQILKALRAHFRAKIDVHKANIEIMLNNPIAIHEHVDFMYAVEQEIEKMAEYVEKLQMLDLLRNSDK